MFEGISSAAPDGDRTGRPSSRTRVPASLEPRVTVFQNLGIPRGILGTSATAASVATVESHLRNISSLSNNFEGNFRNKCLQRQQPVHTGRCFGPNERRSRETLPSSRVRNFLLSLGFEPISRQGRRSHLHKTRV